MRRTISAILLFAVFISLQFGKIAGYLYCKWQQEIVQNKPDCGCDDHLVSMFDQKEDSSTDHQSKITVNDKLSEFSPKSLITAPQLFISVQTIFTEYNSPLSDNPLEPPFHPPLSVGSQQSAVSS